MRRRMMPKLARLPPAAALALTTVEVPEVVAVEEVGIVFGKHQRLEAALEVEVAFERMCCRSKTSMQHRPHGLSSGLAGWPVPGAF